MTGKSSRTTVRGDAGEVTVINVGSSVVTVTINSLGTTAISYSDVIRLNGTWMECNRNRLYISTGLPCKYYS